MAVFLPVFHPPADGLVGVGVWYNEATMWSRHGWIDIHLMPQQVCWTRSGANARYG